MAKAFSDHTSNPLQASASDPINNDYLYIYNQAKQLAPSSTALSSEDELAVWSQQETYQEHVKSVTAQDRFNQFSTPKHADEDMSEDELAFPNNHTTIDPRNQFAFRIKANEKAFLAFEDTKLEDLLEDKPADDEDTVEQDEHIIMDDSGEHDDHNDLDDYSVEDDEMSFKNGPFPEPSRFSPLSPFSSPQSSRPSSPDESRTLYSRSTEEQAEIQQEITTLYKAVPQLKGQYQLLDRLGTGTFSSVYKAIDLLYDDWENRPWLGNHPPESTAYYQSSGPTYKGRGGRGPKQSDVDIDMDAVPNTNPSKVGAVYVAIKRIYTTSGPDRIRNELSILEACRGCRHASQIITAFRCSDQVVIVLAYQRNMDFRNFFQVLHPEGIKCYFRCLFRALRDIHARGIIHRDVKPANFLFDPITGIGTLCDFGLASRMETDETLPNLGKCLHSAAQPGQPHGRYGRVDDTKRALIKTAQREARLKNGMPAEKVGYPDNDIRPVSKANRAGTRGFRAPEVLLKCQAQTGAIDVWSVGVIFLCFLSGKFPIFQSNDDVEALMEIASVFGRKTTERAATLHGRTFATNIPDLQQEGISWQEFVEKLKPDIMTPRKYDMRYYPHNCKHRDGSKSSMPLPPSPSVVPSTSSPPPPTSDPLPMDPQQPSKPTPMCENIPISDRYLNPPSSERYTRDMRNAFDLLEAMLHSESIKRITPREALYHPFLAEPGVDPEKEGDDEFVPYPPGTGVCHELHRVDHTVDEMYAEVWRTPEEVMSLSEDPDMDGDDLDVEKEKLDPVERSGKLWFQDFVFCKPGQGIAIGKRPCEFHRDPRYGLG